MSFRQVVSPDTAFAQALASLTLRTERMEKRQRWQGAVNGPIVISNAGWVLNTDGSVVSETIEGIDPGAWLVLSFCNWKDNGSVFGDSFVVDTVAMNGVDAVADIGSVSLSTGGVDPGRFRSVTFAARIAATEPFRIRMATVGNVAETAVISDIYVSTIAFPA